MTGNIPCHCLTGVKIVLGLFPGPHLPLLSVLKEASSPGLSVSLFTESAGSDRKDVKSAASTPHHLPLLSSVQLAIKTHDKLANENSAA